jgi:hypothetical protein
MRSVLFFAAGALGLAIACSQPANTDLFEPPKSSGPTVTGTGGDPSTGSTTGSTTSESGATTSSSSAATGGAGGSESGAGGASVTGGAGGVGGEPTTTGAGGSDPGTGGSAGSDDAGGGGSGGGGTADAGGGSERRIRCGKTTCSALDQFCCLRDGHEPRCEPIVGGNCAAGGDRVYCDDRGDCAFSSQICCAADLPSTNSLADCRLPGACNGAKAQRLCDPSDPSSCAGFGMTGVCKADGQSTIDGYAYCH